MPTPVTEESTWPEVLESIGDLANTPVGIGATVFGGLGILAAGNGKVGRAMGRGLGGLVHEAVCQLEGVHIGFGPFKVDFVSCGKPGMDGHNQHGPFGPLFPPVGTVGGPRTTAPPSTGPPAAPDNDDPPDNEVGESYEQALNAVAGGYLVKGLTDAERVKRRLRGLTERQLRDIRQGRGRYTIDGVTVGTGPSVTAPVSPAPQTDTKTVKAVNLPQSLIDQLDALAKAKGSTGSTQPQGPLRTPLQPTNPLTGQPIQAPPFFIPVPNPLGGGSASGGSVLDRLFGIGGSTGFGRGLPVALS